MLKLGLGLTQAKTGLDIDALLFCERSGARDVGRISEFVRGVKALGLWNSMVCWPLRSTQNAGTGTTAYSLGGLGTFNGTLIDGPTWGVDGIDFVAASSTHITTALDVAGLRQFTAIVAYKRNSTVTTGIIGAWPLYFLMRTDIAPNIQMFVRNASTNRTTSGLGGANDTFAVAGMGTQGANTVLTNNGASVATMAFLPDETVSATLNMGITIPPTNAPYNGTLAWSFFYKDNELTTAQQLSVYTLYKSTLGTGLGLP